MKGDEGEDFWKGACADKFRWVKQHLSYGMGAKDAESVAFMADERGFKQETGHHTIRKHVDDFAIEKVQVSGSKFNEYSGITWKDLYYKLCFEQMLDEFHKLREFKVMYEYINEIGDQIKCLRIKVQCKTKLKSNHYWLMVLLTKLKNLQCLKIHSTIDKYVTPDLFKFMLKGISYMEQEGRQFSKVQFHKLLNGSVSQDFLYQCLKPNNKVQVLDFSGNTLSV